MRLNKPHGDPHSAPNTLHRTFNQGLHAQLTCNLIGALVGAPVSHDRSTGNHVQRLYFCKVVMSSSVMPSAKNSSGSAERLASGSTAIEVICGWAATLPREKAKLRPIAA